MEAATVSRMPERSLAQRRAALATANQHRVYRAEVKQEIRRGDLDVLPFVLAPPAEMATMQVFKLLLAVPKYGRVKVNRLLCHCRISPSKTLGGLSDRQRHEIASVLTAR